MNPRHTRLPLVLLALTAILTGCGSTTGGVLDPDGDIVTIWSHTKPDTTPDERTPSNRAPVLARRATPAVDQSLANDAPATVVIIATVNQQGAVTQTQTKLATDPAFEPPAVAAVMRYRFKPALEDGKPIVSRVKIPIKFERSGTNNAQTAEVDDQPNDGIEPNGKLFAPIGKTSPANPYAKDKYTMSGRLQGSHMAFIASLGSDNFESQLTITNDSRVLLMKDKSGKTVFEGPVDTADQRSALNQDQLYILERLNTAVVGKPK